MPRANPFFIWWNATTLHVWTHIPKEAEGISGQGFYNDAMVLQRPGGGASCSTCWTSWAIADDTIVQYSTDNGPHYNCWRMGRSHPGAVKRTTNWRAPSACPASCAGRANSRPAGWVNGIVTHHEWLPTLLAAAGEPEIVEKLKEGPRPAKKPSTSTSTAQSPALSNRRGPTSTRATSSSTSAMTANSPLYAWAIGRLSTWNNGAKTMQLWAEPL